MGVQEEFGTRPHLEQGIIIVSFLNSQQLKRLNLRGVCKYGVHFKSHSQEVLFVIVKGIFEELSQHDPVEAEFDQMPPGENDIVMIFILIVQLVEEVKEGFKIIYLFLGQLLLFIHQIIFFEATTLNDCNGVSHGID